MNDELPGAWVLRLDSGGWWSGQGHGSQQHPMDAATFDSPASCREAMAAVGWEPVRPGWIEPLGRALARTAPVQLGLAL